MSEQVGGSSPSLELDAWLRLRPEQRTEAERWFRILRRKLDPSLPTYNPNVTIKELAEEASEDEATVCRKLARWEGGIYEKSGRLIVPPKCKAALAPKLPGPPRGRSLVPEEKRQRILDILALQLRRAGRPEARSAKAVYDEHAAECEMNGQVPLSFAQVRRIVHEPLYQELLAGAGGIEALRHYGGLPRLIVPPPAGPNCEWYLDQWVADIIVGFPDGATGRLVLVTVIDRHVGFALGRAIHRRFTGYTVTEAVIDAIVRHGKPLGIRLDLGKENRTRELRAGSGALGTELAHTTPRDPAVKGIIERYHEELRKFCTRLPWNCPSDIRRKPLRDEEPLTEQEAIERLTTFIFGHYNCAPYHGTQADGGRSRADLRAAASFTPIRVDEQELRILFAKAKLVTVWPQGIKLHGIFYTDPALGKLIGEKVWARQGRTDTEVIVHDKEMRLVCVARNALAESAQLDDEGRRQFTADRRALAKALATQADEQISRARSKPDWLLRRAEKRMAEQDGQPPRPGIRQVNPATGQTPAVASAQAGGRLKRYRYQK